jgi:hypothetical protein
LKKRGVLGALTIGYPALHCHLGEQDCPKSFSSFRIMQSSHTDIEICYASYMLGFEQNSTTIFEKEFIYVLNDSSLKGQFHKNI